MTDFKNAEAKMPRILKEIMDDDYLLMRGTDDRYEETEAAKLDRRFKPRSRSTLRRILPAAALILIACAGYALATPWTIDRGDGVHVPNPSCSSAACHDTGIPDKPSKPGQPRPSQSSPTAPHVPQDWTGTCCLDPERNVIEVHTAFGHSFERAAQQCRERLQRKPKVCGVKP